MVSKPKFDAAHPTLFPPLAHSTNSTNLSSIAPKISMNPIIPAAHNTSPNALQNSLNGRIWSPDSGMGSDTANAAALAAAQAAAAAANNSAYSNAYPYNASVSSAGAGAALYGYGIGQPTAVGVGGLVGGVGGVGVPVSSATASDLPNITAALASDTNNPNGMVQQQQVDAINSLVSQQVPGSSASDVNGQNASLMNFQNPNYYQSSGLAGMTGAGGQAMVNNCENEAGNGGGDSTWKFQVL